MRTWEGPDGATHEKEFSMEGTSREAEEPAVGGSGPAGTAGVHVELTTKVSDSAYYGEGNWDKIPYSVEVRYGVHVTCGQTEEEVVTAQNIAYDLAWEGCRTAMARTVLAHDYEIRHRIYPSLFGNKPKEVSDEG